MGTVPGAQGACLLMIARAAGPRSTGKICRLDGKMSLPTSSKSIAAIAYYDDGGAAIGFGVAGLALGMMAGAAIAQQAQQVCSRLRLRRLQT